MHVVNSHARSRWRSGLVSIAAGAFLIVGLHRVRVLCPGVALAPDANSLGFGNCLPTLRQWACGHQEKAACLLIQGRAAHPKLVAEGGILHEVVPVLFLQQCGVMARPPVDNRREQKLNVLATHRHLHVHVQFFAEFQTSVKDIPRTVDRDCTMGSSSLWLLF